MIRDESGGELTRKGFASEGVVVRVAGYREEMHELLSSGISKDRVPAPVSRRLSIWRNSFLCLS